MSECPVCNYEGDSILISEEENGDRIKLISCSKCGSLKEKQIWKKEFF